MAKPIEVHFWPTPNGYKITIALEEMGLPYTIVPVNIGRGDQFEPAFEAISPNRRMPAIVDPEGPGGAPVSIFESGAILQYLGRKSGKLYGPDERGRIEVDQWLFWQVAGLGPMAGQAHHFRGYAPAMLPDRRFTAYGATRYTNEVHRLYGVLNTRLADREHVAGDYSIADIAIWPWISPWRAQGIEIEEFPHIKAWYARIEAREAVARGKAVGEALRRDLTAANADGQAARSVLFGQRAR